MAKPVRVNRVPIMLTDAEMEAIDHWRYENRVATRSAAIRILAADGLKAREEARKQQVEAQREARRLERQLRKAGALAPTL